MNQTQSTPAIRSTPSDESLARSPARRAPISEVMHMRATIGVFRRHLWAFLTIAVLVPACAWISIQRTTPRYTAAGSLIYEPSDYKLRELESILRSDPTTEAVMASQAEVLQSLKIAQRVAERGNLYANPEFNSTLRPPSALRAAVKSTRALFGEASSPTH